jgi:hypothetical protein
VVVGPTLTVRLPEADETGGSVTGVRYPDRPVVDVPFGADWTEVKFIVEFEVELEMNEVEKSPAKYSESPSAEGEICSTGPLSPPKSILVQEDDAVDHNPTFPPSSPAGASKDPPTQT